MIVFFELGPVEVVTARSSHIEELSSDEHSGIDFTVHDGVGTCLMHHRSTFSMRTDRYSNLTASVSICNSM